MLITCAFKAHNQTRSSHVCDVYRVGSWVHVMKTEHSNTRCRCGLCAYYGMHLSVIHFCVCTRWRHQWHRFRCCSSDKHGFVMRQRAQNPRGRHPCVKYHRRPAGHPTLERVHRIKPEIITKHVSHRGDVFQVCGDPV